MESISVPAPVIPAFPDNETTKWLSETSIETWSALAQLSMEEVITISERCPVAGGSTTIRGYWVTALSLLGETIQCVKLNNNSESIFFFEKLLITSINK